ncbi:MAG: chain-length determining protein [Prevotella sp.]|jgi:uncharacterized protein involved in exopolysaccharide biosynthesis|nr:chain-length determining protein [Prevotella sp.]MCI1281167.1 chain-length determining protein [Prevotella sp.]
MNDTENIENNSYAIDYKKVFSKIWERRKLFYISLPLALIISSLLIIGVPRYYTSIVKLAPETETPSGANSLSSMASSIFGTDLNITSDAIQPILYPDLMGSKDFLVSMFPIKISNVNNTIKDITYYTYLKKMQKTAWWSKMFSGITKIFSKKKLPSKFDGTGKVDPFRMTKDQNDIALLIQKNIECNVDKKTNVITIEVTDQDPLICATIADSVRNKLQSFITNYRTRKARNDLEYYKKLTEKAKADYEKARMLYGSYADANTEIILESFKSKQEDLENDMQLKFNNYSAVMNQFQLARAKVQERTPAFTILQCATVPIKPTGPKRMIFVLFMVFLTFFSISIYILKDILK